MPYQNSYKRRPQPFAEGGVTGDDSPSLWDLTKGLLTGDKPTHMPTYDELKAAGPVLQGSPVLPTGVTGAVMTGLEALAAKSRASHPRATTFEGQPILGSYIPTSGNIDEFNARKAAVAKALTEAGQHTPEGVEAISYLTARYPNRMKLAPIQADPELRNMENTPIGQMRFEHKPGNRDAIASGAFGPNPKLGQLFGLGIYYSPDVPEHGPGMEPELVNTIGHESQHVVDASRWTHPTWDKNREGEYEEQPIELRATAAGRTSQQGYLKYLTEKARRDEGLRWQKLNELRDKVASGLVK